MDCESFALSFMPCCKVNAIDLPYISPLLLVPDVWNMEQLRRRSWGANLLMGSDLISDLCFKLKQNILTMKALSLPYY